MESDNNERAIGPTETKVRELLYGPEGYRVDSPPCPARQAIEHLARVLDAKFSGQIEATVEDLTSAENRFRGAQWIQGDGATIYEEDGEPKGVLIPKGVLVSSQPPGPATMFASEAEGMPGADDAKPELPTGSRDL